MFDNAWTDRLMNGGRYFDISLDQGDIDKLTRHASLLLQWNRRFNITAITEPMEMALKHYVDSLAVAPRIPRSVLVLDMGSGGGFPGIPLKIARPDLDVVMADSSRKKISFLKHVIRELGLTGIQAVHTRVEDLGGGKGCETGYQVIVSRAFASLDHFVRLADPLLAPRGTILAMKGSDESDTLSLEMGERYTITTHSYLLPGSDISRAIVALSTGVGPGSPEC